MDTGAQEDDEKKWTVEAFDDFISIRDESGDEVCYIDDFTDERKPCKMPDSSRRLHR